MDFGLVAHRDVGAEYGRGDGEGEKQQARVGRDRARGGEHNILGLRDMVNLL